MKKNILVFTSAGMSDPASRIRGYFLAEYLSENGFDVRIFMYDPPKTNLPSKLAFILKDFLNKMRLVVKSDRKTLIYIQRGIISSLPRFSFIFFLFSKVLFRKKVVYDIDDGLFLLNPLVTNSMIKYSDLVVVGGHTLFDYAKRLNKNVILLPVSVDLRRYHLVASRKCDHVRLGFVGSPSTTKYLELLLNPLGELAKSHDFELRVISSPTHTGYRRFNYLFKDLEKRGVKLKLIPWSLEEEFHELQNIDIGLAPLFNGEWERYKCGFKVINYMAAGIPPVASDVGEHSYIIRDGVNGFLCKNDQDWIDKLERLIEDRSLREKMGTNARKTVEERYSMGRNVKNLATVLAKLI